MLIKLFWILYLLYLFILQEIKDVNYIQNELEALEREQKQIDKQAAILEKELRKVMELGAYQIIFFWSII